ncbi:hypothetical protein [Rhodoferax antarcticus]|uniref:Uncharacterized protein n=1 Tax=Rhodoferax antarcticus ANT.BR TaxID=1111071 RepID=A0A1Q8Y932_9BURK|nr:hypothetical protein [Rhodoferax antarcticus]OLP04508.1 hypothetical protein BLL52_4293 [Rhodoferax antarcticus ANT.BR]
MTLLTDAQIYELWESDPEGFYASDAFHDAARAVEAAVIAALKERESAPAPNYIVDVSEIVAIAQPVPMTHEHWLAIREGHLNAAVEEYFGAR